MTDNPQTPDRRDRIAAPADWIDGHPQLEAIAAAVWEQCRTEGTSLVVDDPRNIAVAALGGVLAMLPPPASRADVSACICGHPEQQHFEDACLACDCGDYLEPEAAREVIGRWREAAGKAERIRENADFHLGQEMARRQLAEKEVARLSAGRAAVLNAAAQQLYTALFPVVYDDMGQKAAEGVNRAVSELRRMADEAQQQEPVRCPLCPDAITLHTPDGARAHFTAAHPEQRVTGRSRGPWPLLVPDQAEAQQQPDTETRCGPVPDQCDAEAGEPCANHEREQAHAEGEHAFCGAECTEAEPTPEQTVRNHVLALHQIGEQLAGIESWMWEHLADVRAVSGPRAADDEQDGARS